jgi:signal transduction histidine kinase
MVVKEIDINQLFQTIITNFNFQLAQLGAAITAKDIPSCYGDENLLNSLFSNIIGNAIKYHDQNRRLVIEITARKEFRKVIYSIRDTGIGIEPRHLQRIWDIFYRVDPTLTDTGEGLGLSSSKRIAEKHHGRVWAESEAGKGSVFYVELQTTEFSEFQ